MGEDTVDTDSPRIGKETASKFLWQLLCQVLGIGHNLVVEEP